MDYNHRIEYEVQKDWISILLVARRWMLCTKQVIVEKSIMEKSVVKFRIYSSGPVVCGTCLTLEVFQHSARVQQVKIDILWTCVFQRRPSSRDVYRSRLNWWTVTKYDSGCVVKSTFRSLKSCFKSWSWNWL